MNRTKPICFGLTVLALSTTLIAGGDLLAKDRGEAQVEGHNDHEPQHEGHGPGHSDQGSHSRTHNVTVHADGSFSPRDLVIRDGDRVRWRFSERNDTIIPVDTAQTGPSVCQSYRPFNPADPNEFTGPRVRGAAGVFLLGSNDLSQWPHYSIPARSWNDSDQFSGVFIRPNWSEVQLGPDSYDWRLIDEAIQEAVDHGKLFSIGVKAGTYTPAWIFDPSIAVSGAATPVPVRDGPLHITPGSCGVYMNVGSPADANYRRHYFGMLHALAEHIKANNAWYRALAYVKPSGLNLFTHENKLAKRCWSPTGSGLTNAECDCDPNASQIEDRCVCNPQVWAVQGNYTPTALYDFYSEQFSLLASEFPDKDMSYALIQDGFPLINDAGEYQFQDVVMRDGEYLDHPDPALAPQFELPSGTQETTHVLSLGVNEQGIRFAVQHNALDNTGKVNKWVQTAGEMGQLTGLQTVSGIDALMVMEESFNRAFAETNAVFIEIYISSFELMKNLDLASNEPGNQSFAYWNEKLLDRRRDPAQPISWLALGDPLPTEHQHQFRYIESDATRGSDSDANQYHYVHGSKCDPSQPFVASIRVEPRRHAQHE